MSGSSASHVDCLSDIASAGFEVRTADLRKRGVAMKCQRVDQLQRAS